MTHDTIAKPLAAPLAPGKFQNADTTAKGERRAHVKFQKLSTLWFNTGTLCNIECTNCYIESSPTNDRLVYLTKADVAFNLRETERLNQRPATVAFTGGEPFMNPDMPSIMSETIIANYDVLILSNAMRPMMRPRVQSSITALTTAQKSRLIIRVSLDHWRADLHDEERGTGSFAETLEGLRWLRDQEINTAIAGRTKWGDLESDMRDGFARLFQTERLKIDAADPAQLVIFPEMDVTVDVPEITVDCWRILNKSPNDMMCATSRMVVKRKGQRHTSIVACTLLPYEMEFDLGDRLESALRPVKLNHPHCAKFCVLGGGSCKA